jgi:hypothetical protein
MTLVAIAPFLASPRKENSGFQPAGMKKNISIAFADSASPQPSSLSFNMAAVMTAGAAGES